MQTIEIRYRPIRWFPWSRKVRGSFPSSWEEISPRQLIALANLSEKDPLDRLVTLFSGLPRRVCRRMDSYQLTSVWWLSDWMEKELSCHRFVIRQVPAGRTLLESPRPGLRRMSFGQFIFVDTAYTSFLDGNKPEDLDRFVASLYLPSEQLFTDELPLRMEPEVRKVPERVKQALLLNYSLVRRWLAGRYTLLFALPDDNSSVEEKKTAPKIKNSGSWIRVFDSLVGDDISRHQEYADIPLHNVLRYLTARTKENMKR